MSMICSPKQVFENKYQGEPTNYFSILQSDEVTNQKTGETSKYAIKFSKDLGHYENPEGQTKEEKGAWISEGKLEAHVHPEQMVAASQNYKAAQQQWFQQAHPEFVQQQQQVPQQQYAQMQPQYQAQAPAPQMAAPQQVAPEYDRPVQYLGDKTPPFVNNAARQQYEKSASPQHQAQSLSQRAVQATKASDAQEKSAPAQVKGAVELG